MWLCSAAGVDEDGRNGKINGGRQREEGGQWNFAGGREMGIGKEPQGRIEGEWSRGGNGVGRRGSGSEDCLKR